MAEIEDVKLKIVNKQGKDYKQVYVTGISSAATGLDIRLDFFTDIPDFSSMDEKGRFKIVERVYLLQIVLPPLVAKQAIEVLKTTVDGYEQKQREMKEKAMKEADTTMYG